MRRLLWPLGLVVGFGLGLAAGGLLQGGRSTRHEVEQLRAAESRLRSQVSTLQARLFAREKKLAGQPSVTTGQAAMSQEAAEGVETRPGGHSPAGLALEEPARPRRLARRGLPPQGEPQDDLTASGRVVHGTVAPAPTVEAALERFYRYLDDTNAGGAARWQRIRELADDLRAMGNAGAEALLRVLAGGTSSDERRAAAQLLGELQIGRALPLLQDILDKDNDVLLRRAAASGLRRLQTPETVPVLEMLLANPGEDRFVRMSAALGLAQLGKSQGVTGLVQIFEESNVDGRGRDMAFRALSSLSDERALPFMRQLLTSGAEPSYRLQAIRFLTAQGDRQALLALELVMHSPAEQPSIRDAAAQAHAAIAAR
jgi:HEAT repeat protein